MSKRKDAEDDARKGHDDRCAGQQGNGESLMIGQVDASECAAESRRASLAQPSCAPNIVLNRLNGNRLIGRVRA
jgi:hypothetical protein